MLQSLGNAEQNLTEVAAAAGNDICRPSVFIYRFPVQIHSYQVLPN